jgi:hypothetical protein
MSRIAICVALLALCLSLTSIPLLADDAASPHVCVGVLQSAGGSISGTVARDTLIKWLGKQKKGTVQTVPLDASVPDEALVEAKQKNCEYVVTTNLVEDHTESGYSPGAGTTTSSIPNFFVTVTYKLNKVADGADVASGSFKAQDTGSPQNAVGFTLNKIAGKVVQAVKGAK